MKTTFLYDSEYDNLIILEKEKNEKVKRNFMFDEIVISLTNSGKVVGLEIRDISKFLKEIGFNVNLLSKIEKVKLIVKPKKDSIFIGFAIGKSTSKTGLVYQQIPAANLPISCIN